MLCFLSFVGCFFLTSELVELIELLLLDVCGAGFDDRRPPEGRVPVLSGVLYGSVPAGRTEDDQPQGDDGGHAEAAARLPHQLRGDAAAHPHRQRPGRAREREDRTAHHEERARRPQPLRPGQGRRLQDRERLQRKTQLDDDDPRRLLVGSTD